jgi:hypothetical protein
MTLRHHCWRLAFFASGAVVISWVSMTMFGVVAGGYLVVWVSVYALFRQLPGPIRIGGALCAVICCVLPWFNLGRGAFIYPGASKPLPTFAVPQLLHEPLSRAYGIAQFPVQRATRVHSEISEFVYFADSGTVRPFVVFIFWLGIATGTTAACWSRARSTKTSLDLSQATSRWPDRLGA